MSAVYSESLLNSVCGYSDTGLVVRLATKNCPEGCGCGTLIVPAEVPLPSFRCPEGAGGTDGVGAYIVFVGWVYCVYCESRDWCWAARCEADLAGTGGAGGVR